MAQTVEEATKEGKNSHINGSYVCFCTCFLSYSTYTSTITLLLLLLLSLLLLINSRRSNRRKRDYYTAITLQYYCYCHLSATGTLVPLNYNYQTGCSIWYVGILACQLLKKRGLSVEASVVAKRPKFMGFVDHLLFLRFLHLYNLLPVYPKNHILVTRFCTLFLD